MWKPQAQIEKGGSHGAGHQTVQWEEKHKQRNLKKEKTKNEKGYHMYKNMISSIKTLYKKYMYIKNQNL